MRPASSPLASVLPASRPAISRAGTPVRSASSPSDMPPRSFLSKGPKLFIPGPHFLPPLVLAASPLLPAGYALTTQYRLADYRLLSSSPLLARLQDGSTSGQPRGT